MLEAFKIDNDITKGGNNGNQYTKVATTVKSGGWQKSKKEINKESRKRIDLADKYDFEENIDYSKMSNGFELGVDYIDINVENT